MTNEQVTAYLALGSNMGDRRKNLDMALNLLKQRVKVEKISPAYETEPVGDTDQTRFLNLVCQVETSLTPPALLAVAKGIESKLGRTGRSGGPRPIDIDILLYGKQVVDTPELVIPHPRMAERAFVLVPLAEIAPDLTHPVSGKTVKEMLAGIGIKEKQGVFKWDVK